MAVIIMAEKQKIYDGLKALLTMNAVLWIESNLYHPDGYDNKIKLRPFQKELIDLFHSGKDRFFTISVGRQSGKSVTLAATLVYRAKVLKRRVVVVTPSENHLTELWSRIEGVIRYNVEIQKNVRNVQSPYRIMQFNNGGWIKGILGGSDENKEKINARSFGCDDLFVDEAAFLSPKAWRVIIPYLTNNKTGICVLTSTPSEYEDFFYRTHHEDNSKFNFVRRHWTARDANPMYDDAQDQMNRVVMTPEEYDREINANFPTKSGGVFPPDAVKDAAKDYKYGFKRTPGYKLVFGVDWNTAQNGTQITLLEFNSREYRVLNHIIISNISNVQTISVAKIIELNKALNPDYIFVDEGFGNTQIELLHQHGILDRLSRLEKKVVPIDFKTSISYIINKKEIKKEPKQLMVGLLSKIIQDRRFSFSQYDNHKISGLWTQLRNFKVKKKTFGQTTTYSDGYFHGITAVMIALVGIYKYYSPYSPDYVRENNFYASFDSSEVFDIYSAIDKESKAYKNKLQHQDHRNADPKYIDFNNFLDKNNEPIKQRASGCCGTRSIYPNKKRAF